jgi:1,4-dihydroxy-6-naphthoate synthase
MPADTRPILRLGHSPDPDDAFMWWPLFELHGRPPAIDTGRFRYAPVLDDIESLNQRSRMGGGELEITAISCAHYPHVRTRYALTACGASVGDGYGPKLVARRQLSLVDLNRPDIRIAIPGTHTTAFTTLCLALGSRPPGATVVPFEQIIDRVAGSGGGDFDAGLVIHEGQLTFERSGLRLILDLGAWWRQTTATLLPLGVNALRRDLETLHGRGTLTEITATLRASIEHAMHHREHSVSYAMQFARGMSSALADEFIGLYVNRWTLDFADDGRRAVQLFLDRAHRAGLLPDPGVVDFIQPGPAADPVNAA